MKPPAPQPAAMARQGASAKDTPVASQIMVATWGSNVRYPASLQQATKGTVKITFQGLGSLPFQDGTIVTLLFSAHQWQLLMAEDPGDKEILAKITELESLSPETTNAYLKVVQMDSEVLPFWSAASSQFPILPERSPSAEPRRLTSSAPSKTMRQD